jgi:GAF domain-containing protein
MRLRALRRCEILDTPPEHDFNRLVFTAAHAFRVPVAAIALIDAARLWYKAKVGISLAEFQRDVSFAAAVVEAAGLTIIENVLEHARFKASPLVQRTPFVRFYAGAPIYAFGQPVGALGIMDTHQRSLIAEQAALLKALAAEASGLVMKRLPAAPAESG